VTGLPRVAHLVSHPIQYFAPVYRELTRRGNIDLRVFFRSDQGLAERVDPGFGRPVAWDIPLLEGYRSTFLGGATRRGAGDALSLSGGDMAFHLVQGGYDVLWVHGYSHVAHLMAMLVANAWNLPILLRDDAHLLDQREAWRVALKACLLRPIMRMIAGGLYVGTENRAWLQHYGVPANKLFYAPYAVDNTYFRAEALRLSPKRPSLRAGFGFNPRQTVFLFAGKLVPKKAPLDLVRAFAAVRQQHPAGLLIAGDGPLRPHIEQELQEHGIADVTITGFLNQSQISAAYAAADVLVLPSHFQETWGLVVNEAMNFGLPAIVSDKVGCADDLVDQGDTGFVVPAGDMGALAAAMGTLAGDALLRERLGRRALEIITTRTVAAAAACIESACYAVRRRQGAR
jgi:glycosyltransferase involved in cell wall biosynthesis